MPRKVECWIEAFLQYTENSEPRESYRRWVAISTVASALQRKCWLAWGVETFYPNMYIVLTGPPAARKGTAMKPGRKFLDKLGVRISADQTSRQKLIGALKDSQESYQLITGEANIHCSLTIIATELTVFTGYQEKEFLSTLCKLYDCEARFLNDTYARGEEEVPNVWANLLGATTPSQLQASMPEGFIGSGFTSRVIFVFEESMGKVVIKPVLTDLQRSLEPQLLHDLNRIHMLQGDFSTTPEFEERYTRWRYEAERHPPFQDSRLEYYIQRRPGHLFKLSMIYSAARRDDLVITEDDLEAAVWTLEATEKKMPMTFRGVGENPLSGVQTRLHYTLKQQGELTLPEITRAFSDDATRTQISEAIATLEQMGICRLDLTKTPRTLIYKGD